MNNGEVARPGVSPEFLARHNIRHVDEIQAESLTGFKAAGILIPYAGLNSPELIVKDRPFCRIRLDKPRNGTKYLQAHDTGSQLFIPQGPPFGKELVIVEGEFKAMSLCEAGIRVVGIGGITSAMKDGELIADLDRILRKYPIEKVLFLGDSDTALNFDFSREACKLARKLPEACILRLPRIPLSAPGKGIDDIREFLGDGFLDFWLDSVEKAVAVSSKTNPSALCVKLLLPELPTIKSSPRRDDYEAQVISLAGWLESVPLDKLASALKEHLGIGISALKQNAAQRNHDDATGVALPGFYFDGMSYFRPNQVGFERLSREDAALDLRQMGFRHRLAAGCEFTPCEVALHRLQKEHRVDYAGPLCGRPVGFWQEGGTRVLCTHGPTIIDAKEGDASPMEALLCSLLGKDGDPYFDIQFFTLAGWILRARQALKNPNQHLPGQVLALVGPRDCGKSLFQSLVTIMLGGRQVDPSGFLIRGSDFNGELWTGEHLRLGDEELAEDNRDRHGLQDRLKKTVVAELYPLHAKYRDAKTFRPIWRLTISGNDDGNALPVLPPPTGSFADKIIYLRCYPPEKPYHDGTEEAAKEFWQRLVGAIPAFLHDVENTPIPDQLRASRFYVKEFHHPDIVELISGAAPVAPLGELITKWLSDIGHAVEGSASEIFEQLRSWYKERYDANLTGYSKSARHFGHQLSALREFPGWRERIAPGHRYVGPHRWKQTIWKITPA